MTAPAPSALDARLAVLLQVGTGIASAVIAFGLAVPSFGRAVTAGIALFIALPVIRVVVMLIDFLRRRDFRIGGVAALVLTVILVAVAVGVRMGKAGG